MNERNLRDELTAQESFSPELKSKYAKEIAKMIERPLTFAERLGWTLCILLGTGFLIGFGGLAIFAPAEFSIWGRIIFAFGSFGGLVEIVFSLYVLKQGRINILSHTNAVYGYTWGFMVIMMTILLLAGSFMEDVSRGTFLVLYGLVFFMMFAIPALIIKSGTQSEYNLREQMLKLELRIVELGDKLESKKSD